VYIDGFAIIIVALLLLVSGAVMLRQSLTLRALTRNVCRVLAYVNMNTIPYSVPMSQFPAYRYKNAANMQVSPNFSNALNDLWIAVGCPRPRPVPSFDIPKLNLTGRTFGKGGNV
jgi:hypothetical protein